MSLKSFIQDRESLAIMSQGESVKDAIDLMMEQKCGAVLITFDGKRPCGIFTERDVMTKVTAENRDPATTPLRTVMTSELIVLDHASTVQDAIRIMSKHKIRHLPVVEGDEKDEEIVGMISLRTVLHEHIRDLMDELDGLEAYLNDAPGG